MPRKYKRKAGVQPRVITWSPDSLAAALSEMQEGRVSVNNIATRHGIPCRTLRRRFAARNMRKVTLGNHPALDFDNENRLAAEILKLEEEGITPTRDMIRKRAFEFAETLGLKVPFNKKTRMAGVCWLTSFLERHPEVKVQGSSLPSLQETTRKRQVNTVTRNLTKHAVISQDLLSHPKETVFKHSHDSDDDSDDDPLAIKIELFDVKTDHASIAAPLDNELYSPTPQEDEVENPECSSNKDLIKKNLPALDESRNEIAEVKCDGMDLLFLGYAAAVKKLSRRKQIVVKQEISRIIAEAELSDLE